jgi:DNA-binding IclR family transcriptional regulator
VTSPGDRLPAFCCSTGRALLARLDDEAVRARYTAPLEPPSPNAPQTMDELLAALAVVRDKGWSLATDESLPGVESIAVCIEDPEGGESISICISYSAAMISANEKTRIITLLMRAGCELGLKFDDAFWAAPRFAAFAAPSWNEAA